MRWPFALQLSFDDRLARLEDAAKCALSTVVVDPNGERLLRTGRPIEATTTATGPVAVLSEGGALVAIAEPRDGKLTVLRGFSP